ncbi:cell division protein ZipA [Natronospira sp.]|uniref:cell division protein ZipA n=1 Tax=Natronospira sp. TaxID=2024970 RepID=UPI003872BA52
MPELRLALIGLGVVLVIAVYAYTRWQGREREQSLHRPPRPSQRVDSDELPRVKLRPEAGEAVPSEPKSGVEEDELPSLRPETPALRRESRAAATSPEPESPERSDRALARGLGRLRERLRDLGAAAEESAPEPDVRDDHQADGALDAQAGDEPELPEYNPNSQKIVSLHVRAVGEQGLEGAGLRQLLEQAGARHGQYQIFHRSERDEQGKLALLFSVANMVEPGHFDLAEMDYSHYRGITLFAVLPGPWPGVETFHEMLSLAHQVAETLGGDVRDEARNPFSRQRATYIEEEITEFERLRRQVQRQPAGSR